MNKKLTTNTVFFIIADVINKAIPFLLLPILTKYLGASDYGILTIYNSILSFAQVLVGFSIVGFLNLNYFKVSENNRKEIVSTSILLFFILFFVSLTLGLFVNEYILPEITIFWSFIISLTAFLFNINNLKLSLLILEQKPLTFSIYQIFETLVKVAISLTLIMAVGFNWSGRSLGILAGTFSLSLITISSLYTKDQLVFVKDTKYLIDIYKYGITLLIHQVSQWVKQNIDKIFILFIFGKASIGIYSVAVQLGIVLGIITTAFNKSWVPYFFKQIQDSSNEKKIFKTIIYYIPSILLLATILYYIFKFILLNYFEQEFHEAIEYIPYILLGYSFQGMYFMVVNYMFYLGKNKLMSLISFITTGIHIVLIYFGVNEFGLLGVGVAFAITYLSLFIFTSIMVIFFYKKSNQFEV